MSSITSNLKRRNPAKDGAKKNEVLDSIYSRFYDKKDSDKDSSSDNDGESTLLPIGKKFLRFRKSKNVDSAACIALQVR